MNQDLISRQAALHYIADWQYGEAKLGNEAVYDTIENCYKMIEQLPSVQPEPSEYEELDFVKEHERIPVTLTVQPETEERTAESAQNVPKGELISKKAAIDASCTCHGGKHCNHYPCKDVQAIMDLPSVQPQRMRGKWVEKTVAENPKAAGIEEWQSCKCSNCGRYDTRPYMYYFIEPNYCSYCGADMRGEQDEQVD